MEPSPWSWTPATAEIAAVLALAGAYVLAAQRFGATRGRATAFAASLVLVLAVSVTPVATLALEYLLAAHLVQNVVLAEWAPGLAVLGMSAPMAAAAARLAPVRALVRPYVALPLWLATYGLWHVPAAYDAALRNAALLHLEHATYFLAGLLLWWPLVHDEPGALSTGERAAYAFAAFLFASPLGLFLTFLPRPIYDFYVEAPRIWGLDPLTDQRIAGVLMSASEAIVFFAVFLLFVLRFLRDEADA